MTPNRRERLHEADKLMADITDDHKEEGVAESNRQVRNAGPFPDVPLTVIAATDHGRYVREWELTLMWLQQQLATLSPRGSLIVAQGSGHDVQLDRPETVIEAVGRMGPPCRRGDSRKPATTLDRDISV